MSDTILITKSDGTTQPFDRTKLANSLKRAGASIEAIDDVVMEVEKEMRPNMPTADIYRRAFDLLRKHAVHVAVKYSLRHAMFDLGPDGFPFEKFVARVFKLWGYEAVTDQTLMGTCVEHEVDVVAWKDDELSMVEAKFHNEIGLKSDLKVALYVKSRFDDLADTTFDYGGKHRKLTGRWLFTNTKFTEAAIKYGECKDLKLVSWNHPEHGNLHELIEQNGLHPITCINSLTHQQKKDLIGHNILVCLDLKGNEAVLNQIGLKGEQAQKVLTEAEMIVREAK